MLNYIKSIYTKWFKSRIQLQHDLKPIQLPTSNSIILTIGMPDQGMAPAPAIGESALLGNILIGSEAMDAPISKDISGYEDFYEIYSDGKIKMKPRVKNIIGGKTVLIPGRIKKTIFTNKGKGTELVTLTDKNGKTRSLSVARLVAEHFIEKIPPGKHIRRRDGNNKNNSVSNLYIE